MISVARVCFANGALVSWVLTVLYLECRCSGPGARPYIVTLTKLYLKLHCTLISLQSTGAADENFHPE